MVCFVQEWRDLGWRTTTVLEWWLSWRWLSWDSTVVDHAIVIVIGSDTKFDVGPQ
jgi:hypothetical protein